MIQRRTAGLAQASRQLHVVPRYCGKRRPIATAQLSGTRGLSSTSRSLGTTRPSGTSSCIQSLQSTIHSVARCGFCTTPRRHAQPQTADAVMENLNDLYSTAKDEFEMAAEETEKKTIYAADDREAAKEAFGLLKEAYEKAIRKCDPDTAKQVQSRTGPRIKELENALTAVEEMAMED